MPKFVRVKLENGALATVAEGVAKAADLKPLDEKDHPALDGKGRPLPVEHPADEEQPAPEGDKAGDAGDQARHAASRTGDKPTTHPAGS